MQFRLISLTIGVAAAAAASPALAQTPPSPNTAALVAAANGNSQLQSTASYIGALCPNLAVGTDLRLRCGAALSAALNARPLATTALDQITPQEILAQGGVIDGAISPGASAVAGRIASLGNVGFGSGLAAAYRPVVLASNGDTAGLGGPVASKLQVFGNVTFGAGDRDTNALETGYDYDQRSITAGADLRFSNRFTAGLAFSYGDTDLDFDARGGALSAKSATVSAYGLWAVTDRVDLTGLVSYGDVDYRSARNITYAESASSTINRVARGSTNGKQWESTVTAAYALSAPEGWNMGPSLSLSYRKLKLDAFSETGADGLNLAFQKQSTDSFQAALGFDVSKAISTSNGIISPYARAQAVYEAMDDRRTVRIRYVVDTTGFFPGIRLTTTAPDRNRMLLGGGVAGQFANGWSAFADAETVLGLKDVAGYNLTFGLRKEF